MTSLLLLAVLVAPPPIKGEVLLAPKAGLFKSTSSLDPGFFVGFELGYASPLLGRRLAFTCDIDYARSPTKGSVADPQLSSGGKTADGTYQLDERQIGLSLSVVLRGEGLVSWFVPYGGLGPSLVLHEASTTAFSATTEEREGSFGLHVLGGLEVEVGPGGVFFEARYLFSQIGFISTGKANAGGFVAAGGGYRVRF